MNVNEVFLRRKHKLNIPTIGNANSLDISNRTKALVMSFEKNIESYGFSFSKEVISYISCMNEQEIKELYFDLSRKLSAIVGADKMYKPMYPNFPNQVMDAHFAELFFNALVHYESFGKLIPKYEKDPRFPLIDSNKTIVLSVGTQEDIEDIFKNLVNSKTSLSNQDKSDIKSISKDNENYVDWLPDEIYLKENVAFISQIIIQDPEVVDKSCVFKYFNTATDVLRLITVLSDGDVSLATPCRYKKFKRSERRFLMDLLSFVNNIGEDMFRHQYEWIRVGEIVHPLEFKNKKYDNVKNAFSVIRSGDKPLMFNGQVQKYIECNDIENAVKLLQSRPGDFARRLDKLIRDSEDQMMPLYYFSDVSKNVSTPVLLQVRQHFLNRMNEDNGIRIFFPKGSVAKAVSIENNLPSINEDVCKGVVDICDSALLYNYSQRDCIGNVYVDKSMSNFIIPFSQRNTNNSGKIITRGSSIPVDKKSNAIRSFIWWTNTKNSRVDIDLSAAIFDKDWNYLSHVSYTKLRDKNYSAYHSGDIVNGGDQNGDGVSEFIDIDIGCIAEKGRYVVFQVYSFTEQKFSELNNCSFGWMEREDVDSGEIFEPTTVEMNIAVTSDSKVEIPVIFDCVDRKFIWCDMNLNIDYFKHYNNVESNLTGVQAACYAITHMGKPNMYDLACLNAIARGNLLDNMDEADVIFSDKDINTESLNDGVKVITPYDCDYFMGELL